MQISIIKFGELEKYSFRLDAEYYKQEYLQIEKEILKYPHHNIGEIAKVTDGEHGSVKYLDSGVYYLMAENIKKGFVDISNVRYVDESVNERNKRAMVNPGNVLVSIKGSLGEIAVAENWLKPANMNRDVAIIKIKTKKIIPEYLAVFLMTDMGKKQAIREGSGGVQQMITLERLRNIAIPIVSNKFQELISNLHSKFLYYKAGSHEKYQQAEELLLSELGLLNWKPKHKLNFVSNFSETEEAKRIDADYFQPKYNAILNQIENYENGFDTVSNQFDQNTSLTLKEKEFYHYIEISDINTSNGEILPSKRGLEDIPANGKRNLVKNDLLVSKVRPYRGAVSFIDFELENLLGSGAFTVLQENPDYKKEVLMIYLRSNCIKELLLRYNCGTSYPVIKDEDILNLKIPLIKQDVQKKIQLKIHLSIKARKQSKQLLEIAKRGVEIAIEENEEIAEKWIKRKIKKLRIKLITKKDEIEKFFKTSKEDFISKKSIKQFIDDNYLNISDETLNSYIKEFKEQKIIYSAGRGWYTTVEKTGSLRTEPVEKIVSLLEKKYPFLKFNCWSTEQIQPYLHHLLGKHLTYVYTSREAISNVTDTLRDSGYSILENPSKNELKESINKLNIDVIIRASIEREPVNNTHTSPIEKVIIDLIYENNMGEMYSELEIAGAIGRVYKTLYVDISQLSEYAARKDVQNFYITINPTM